MNREVSNAVVKRIAVEKHIVNQVITDLLAAGYELGVDDGEARDIHHSTDAKAIKAATMLTDEDWLLVYEPASRASKYDAKNDTPNYFVRFVYGNDGWDVINDYSTALDPVIGDGTKTQALIDKYSD